MPAIMALAIAQEPDNMVANWWNVRLPTKGTIVGPVVFSVGQVWFEPELESSWLKIPLRTSEFILIAWRCEPKDGAD